jgi:alkylation response protein AidB-like acyl-CoA dehydrogenase
VRTDPDAPKHLGISCLILDMHSPGVVVRPIRMATITDETFCEVFLDDVAVPVSSLLGAENAGWQVAMASLDHERDMIWIMNWVEITRGLRSVQQHGAALDDYQLVELGRRMADAEALRLTGYRSLTSSLRGDAGKEFAILKLLGSEALQRTWDLAATVAGAEGLADAGLAFERHDALAATLYGGTSEVQRNIIGERVLGLPKG